MAVAIMNEWRAPMLSDAAFTANDGSQLQGKSFEEALRSQDDASHEGDGFESVMLPYLSLFRTSHIHGRPSVRSIASVVEIDSELMELGFRLSWKWHEVLLFLRKMLLQEKRLVSAELLSSFAVASPFLAIRVLAELECPMMAY